MLGGALVGAASGVAGAAVSASGIPMANTLGILAGSFANSLGTFAYTGGKTDISMSFGAASFNFTQGNFGYLGKKGNHWLQDVGYGFGAVSNISDVVSLATGGGQNIDVNSAKTKNEDWWGHSSITNEDGETLISVGPDINEASTLDMDKYITDYKTTANDAWSNYANEKGTWSTRINNVSSKAMSSHAERIKTWDLGINSCVGHSTRALWKAGVPVLYLGHPHMLNVQLLIRDVGIKASPFLYQRPKNIRK